MTFKELRNSTLYKSAKAVCICVNGEEIHDYDNINSLDELQVIGTGHSEDGCLLIDLVSNTKYYKDDSVESQNKKK